ncbi:Aste57867_911 [Aphanomyces stellatus]|uniref:Aste57867_911 protein n=1 Tax=Aphanomyces stellatus TaxID=120398 RepID=A0A485K734_9STRA|nr:hypothetical protein As57867_000910 [Aphanomyces stellatus]VFT78135.1 Aste57867_911 [Aphanomyces stellatus]
MVEATRLPLPPGYFRTPPLSHDEVEHLTRQALVSAMEVVTMARSSKDTDGWLLLWSQSDLTIHRGPDIGPTAVCVGATEILGTLDELAALFRTDTPAQAKEYVARVGRDLEDAVPLYSLVGPSAHGPREKVGVTWMALQSPVKKIVKTRDCCVLECHHEFKVSGRRGWVRGMQSIELPNCPPVPGLVRMHIGAAGHVFVESERPGYVLAYHVVQADFKTTAMDWVIEMALQRRCRSLLDLDRFLREDRLSQTPYASQGEMQSKHTQRQCHLCTKPFGWLASKTNCAKCGQVFCTACIRAWQLKTSGTNPRRAKVWACTRCGMTANQRHGSTTPATAEGSFLLNPVSGSGGSSSGGSQTSRSTSSKVPNHQPPYHPAARQTTSTASLSIGTQDDAFSHVSSLDDDDMSHYSDSLVSLTIHDQGEMNYPAKSQRSHLILLNDELRGGRRQAHPGMEYVDTTYMTRRGLSTDALWNSSSRSYQEPLQSAPRHTYHHQRA